MLKLAPGYNSVREAAGLIPPINCTREGTRWCTVPKIILNPDQFLFRWRLIWEKLTSKEGKARRASYTNKIIIYVTESKVNLVLK